MGKNSQLHLFLETNLYEELKQESQKTGLSISELCRLKLREKTQLDKIEALLESLNKKMSCGFGVGRHNHPPHRQKQNNILPKNPKQPLVLFLGKPKADKKVALVKAKRYQWTQDKDEEI